MMIENKLVALQIYLNLKSKAGFITQNEKKNIFRVHISSL